MTAAYIAFGAVMFGLGVSVGWFLTKTDAYTAGYNQGREDQKTTQG